MKGEALKLKRTWVWLVVLLAPVVPALLNWQIYHGLRGEGLPWQVFVQNGIAYWSLLLMPFIVTLVVVQVTALEHGSGGWRLNLALPKKRSRLYLSKLGLLFVLTALSNLTAFVAIIVAGALLPHALLEPLPLLWAVQRYVFVWLASSALLAITFFLAVRFASFLVPASVGAVATVVGFIGINNPSFGPWWPWTLPGVILTGSEVDALIYSLLYSLALAATVLAIGLWDFGRRDF